MPRPKYKIGSADVRHATACLMWRLQLQSIDLKSDLSFRTAIQQLQRLTDERLSSVEYAAAVNDWCEQNLKSEAWGQLKAAIRKRRQRNRDLGKTESITISKRAHQLLKQLSKRDNVTFSQLLEKLLTGAVLRRTKN